MKQDIAAIHGEVTAVALVNDDLTTYKPHKPLLAVKQRTGGRRNTGDLTIRHQGGGHSRSCA